MENRLLVVTVTPRPAVKLITWPTSGVSIRGERFEEIGAGDANGFYDYLCLSNGHIVGARCSPLLAADHPFWQSVTPGPRLRVTGTPPTAFVELFWGSDREYSERHSLYGLLEDHYLIFRSPSKAYAVTFGFGWLDENEINDLLSGLPQDAV